jgi:hypothetical protein
MKPQSNQNINYYLFNKLGEKANLINQNKNLTLNSNSEVEFLDKIIQTYSKERDLSREFYEKYPYKLSQLISIVHFTIYIFFQNKNSPRYNQDLNDIFAKLFVLTMKKLNLIENILSLNNSKENARMKLRNNPKNKSKLVENENVKAKEEIQNTKEDEKIVKEKDNKKNEIDEIIREDKEIKNEVDPIKETSIKKIRNLNKNFIDIGRPKKDLNIISITSNNKADKDFNNNNKISGTNYLAQFTKMSGAPIINFPTMPKDKEKTKEEIQTYEKEKKENSAANTNLFNNNNNKTESNNINDNNYNVEEPKNVQELNHDKLINRAYCGPYMQTRNFISSQEAFQSSFSRKKNEFLGLIKEKDEIKAELENSSNNNNIAYNNNTNIINNNNINSNTNSNNLNETQKVEKKAFNGKGAKSSVDLKGSQPANNRKSDNYMHQINSQYTNLPRTMRTFKKDSLKDFCDMLDLTKSKLQTRRVLNKNDNSLNENQSKVFLQAFAAKKNTEGVLANGGEAAKNPAAHRKNIVKLVSSELKNLTKLSKADDGIASFNKNYVLHGNTLSASSADNPLGDTNNANNSKINNGNYVRDNFETGDFKNFKTKSAFNNNINNIKNIKSSPNLIENYSEKNYTVNIENETLNADDMENSNSCFNTNHTNSTNANNMTNTILNNTANNNILLLTPGNNLTKNNSILKRSLFDKTLSSNTAAKEEKIRNNFRKESEKLLLYEDSTKNFSESQINQEMENLNLNSENRRFVEYNKGNTDDNYFSPTDSNNSNKFRKPQSIEIRTNLKGNENNNANNCTTNNFMSNSGNNYFYNNNNEINYNNNFDYNNNYNYNKNYQNTFNPSSELNSRINSRSFGTRKFNSLKLENYDIRNEILVNGNFSNKTSSDDVGEDYYTGSIKFLPEEKISQKSINSDFDLQIRILDSEISLNINKYHQSGSEGKSPIRNSGQSSSASEIDCSTDSNITFLRDTDSRRLNREESLVNEINDEVDSQFDEMIELMDDIQLSDPYREIENDQVAVETKPNTIKISDFKLISEISKGGYGRVDIYKKISTGDIYAIKTVDINKMVNIFFL